MDYDVVVVGAGAMGLSAAYWCQKSGLKTLLLDQYQMFHSKGSSHGESRIIRLSYSEPFYIDMMREAYRLWEKLENESGSKLLFRKGGLDFGREDDGGLKKVLDAHKQANLPNEVLDFKEMKRKFPQFNVDENYIGVYQADSGIVNPDLTLRALCNLFLEQGGKYKSLSPVQSINRVSERYKIQTPLESYFASHIILAVGSWINPFLSKLEMKADVSVWGLTYAFWKTMTHDINYKTMPIFIHWDSEIHYGFPEFEKEGFIKVATHISPVIPEIDPNEAQKSLHQEQLFSTAKFIQKRMNGISPIPSGSTNCRYTMTRNENFILGKLPHHENAIVAAGFSGHGFKFTPLVGKLLSELVQGLKPQFDLSPFDPIEFIHEKNSKF
ncbi:MAG: N-methyl-L-tryptophan oxidase [Methanobacteriota archaeon]|nr:MAG: N-methyl-L-tryptophan oxidase [Euryarchaeota archaeon]